MTPTTEAHFSRLLAAAVTEPGRIHAAYSAFHGYSLGNQFLALMQCAERDLPLGPIATFVGWQRHGRHVMKGQRALTLCMPITCRRREDAKPDEAETFTRFLYKPRWFVLAQTDGDAYEPPALPAWDQARALAALQVTEIAFDCLDGNVQGFARDRSVAVSPVAAMPFKTLFHELGHVLLGHTAEGQLTDGERTPRNLREVEAESVAMLVAAALDLPGVEYSRGYIQHWNESSQPIPEKSAARIFKAADQILRAGRPAERPEQDEN
jgi:N-terminal domain of anti-restriction factor ArdC